MVGFVAIGKPVIVAGKKAGYLPLRFLCMAWPCKESGQHKNGAHKHNGFCCFAHIRLLLFCFLVSPALNELDRL
jgi:hypothetical protein